MDLGIFQGYAQALARDGSKGGMCFRTSRASIESCSESLTRSLTRSLACRVIITTQKENRIPIEKRTIKTTSY